MSDADIIVVGSGCSGAMAAQTLVEKGLRVHMIDVGVQDEQYKNNIPAGNFEDIRKTNNQQHIFFLGKDFEGIPGEETSAGAQLTPPRKHITKYTDDFFRIQSQSFSPVESLAYGGLGAGWGLGCCVYSEKEMEKCSLPYVEMYDAYETVAKRIGISADADDNASRFTIGNVKNHLPPLQLDESKKILDRFNRKKNKINQDDFFLGRPALALLSQNYNGRSATSYDDMHFYHDNGNSAYRPSITIDELKKQNNFQYSGNYLALSFEERENEAVLYCMHVITKEKKEFKAKRIVLAAGALSSARIVMRSFGTENSLSFLCNPYTYYPCLNPLMTGKKISKEKTGMAQLSLFHDANKEESDIAMASLYSYRSLFLFRLLNEVPLNYKDGKEIMRFLLSGILIMGIHHPDQFSSNRFIRRISNSNSPTGDLFQMEYQLSEHEITSLQTRERKFIRVMRKLGYWSLKRVNPKMGSSIHYAGTLPFDKEEKKFTLSKNGRLHGSKNIFVADSSGFTFLPAKGLTYSLMANAHRIANEIF